MPIKTTRHFLCTRCPAHVETEADGPYPCERPEGWGELQLVVPGKIPELTAHLCPDCKAGLKEWLEGRVASSDHTP